MLMLIASGLLFKQLVLLIEKPYFEMVYKEIKSGRNIKAADLSYAGILVQESGFIAFQIGLFALLLYMCFAKKKFWKELLLAYGILVVICVSNNLMWRLIDIHNPLPKGWYTTIIPWWRL